MDKKSNRPGFVIAGILAFFLSLYIIGKDSYLLGWLAMHQFLFLWVPICIAYARSKKIFAGTLLLGSFFGIPIGQLAENLKVAIYGNTNYGNTVYWGVPLYFLIILVTVLTGLYLERKKKS